MRRQLRWYGASPLHLLALLACFGLAGYAAARLVSSHPLAVIVWFLGAVIGHDLLLMPLYSLADRSAMAAVRHHEPHLPAAPWINYVRMPAALSGLLLLVWFPLILRLQSPYHASSALSADPYVWHWLAVTGAMFLLSAVAFALRLRRQSRAAAQPERPAARPAALGGTGPDREGEQQTGTGQASPAGAGGGEQPAVEPGHKADQAAGPQHEAQSADEAPGIQAAGEPRMMPPTASPPAPDAGEAIPTRDGYEY